MKLVAFEVQFRRAAIPREIKSLVAFDHKIFPRADWFPESEWRAYESYWMIVNGVKAGCCAFEPGFDFREDTQPDQLNVPRRGSLYIASTGILPKFQGRGLGELMKSWQIAYARQHGFTRIVTNQRKSNRAIIALNRKFGFRIVRTSKENYYSDPPEPTVVMELDLKSKRRAVRKRDS